MTFVDDQQFNKKERYLNNVVWHTGSRAPHYKFGEHAAKVVRGAAQAGYSKSIYGDGRAGTMGIVAKSAVRTGMEVQGITLDFFLAAQGVGLPGANPTISVHTMTQRKALMRQQGDIVVPFAGGFGTAEEGFEWLASANGVVKPQIWSSIDGYYDGMAQFLEDSVAHGHSLPTLRDRFYIANGADETIELMARLAYEKPQIDPGAPIPANYNPLNHVIMTDTSIVVDRASMDIMEQVSATMVGYDISNVEGQTIWEPHPYLRKIIFDNTSGVFDGFKKQVETIHEVGFTPDDRRQLTYFAETKSELDDVIEHTRLNPILPSAIKLKHAEAKKDDTALDNGVSPNPA